MTLFQFPTGRNRDFVITFFQFTDRQKPRFCEIGFCQCLQVVKIKYPRDIRMITSLNLFMRVRNIMSRLFYINYRLAQQVRGMSSYIPPRIHPIPRTVVICLGVVNSAFSNSHVNSLGNLEIF